MATAQGCLAQSTTITTPTAEKGWAKRACSPRRQPIPPPSRDPQRPCTSLHRRAGLLHPLGHARSSPSSTPASAPRVTNHYHLAPPFTTKLHDGQHFPREDASEEGPRHASWQRQEEGLAHPSDRAVGDRRPGDKDGPHGRAGSLLSGAADPRDRPA